MNRREFCARWGATAALPWLGQTLLPHGAVAWAESDEPLLAANRLVPGKDAGLIVHSARPLEVETPLSLLREQRVTPKNLLFVRNNQEPADALTLAPTKSTDWTIEITGLIEPSRSIGLKQLAELDQVEREMVLQCSGNGRYWFSRAAPAKGSPWRDGAVANVRFGGVSLKTLFAALKLDVPASARFITAEGRDSPDPPSADDFEHSLPLSDALDRSFVALRMNGEALPAVHGGPVRLVTPGYYGTMHVKWLSRLRLEPLETRNHHQVARYRTPHVPIAPGSKFAYDLDNSEPNWRMRIKSLVFFPTAEEQVKSGRVTLRGVAFNDGAARIETVELSRDGGRSWQRTELDVPESPFAWYDWRLTTTISPGSQELWCRAIDTLGRTQPLDGAVFWNPAGYAWNGVHRVKFEVV